MSVELSIENHIAWLTLSRPEKLNAIDRGMARAYAAHVRALRDRSDVRVVITRGAGRAFCAGSDLQDIAPLSPAAAAQAEQEQADAFALLDELPQPTIAMLHGYVLGGGLGLAVYHDFRIAATTTTLGMPEVELGWTPPWALGRLVDTVGSAQARWLALACTRVSGTEALQRGLIHLVVPGEELEQQTRALAERLVALPGAAVQHTKTLLNRMSPLRGPAWDMAAAKAFELCYATEEARANVAAFLARKGTPKNRE